MKKSVFNGNSLMSATGRKATMKSPKFPLTVQYHEGDTVVVKNELEACNQLEWLDTDDKNDPVKVTDAEGRKLRLKISELDIKVCELLE